MGFNGVDYGGERLFGYGEIVQHDGCDTRDLSFVNLQSYDTRTGGHLPVILAIIIHRSGLGRRRSANVKVCWRCAIFAAHSNELYADMDRRNREI
jgi:hypothetical protein